MLAVRGLDVSVAGVPVCHALSFTARQGEFWAVLGRNGSGKTTLLHTLAGLRKPDAGEILLADRSLALWPKRELAQQMGILLQDSEDLFPSTVLESALIGRHPHLGRWDDESLQDVAIARQALAEMDLAERDNTSTRVLSGGERRRLALATLFTQTPRVLLLDEPVNHLDLQHQVRALESVAKRVRDKACVALAVLHDVNLAARFCNRVLMMHGNGHVVSGLSEDLMNGEQLSLLFQHRVREITFEGERLFVPG